MTMKLWVRQPHRWVSVAVTIVSAAMSIALGVGRQPARWVCFLPLFPLALLALSVHYMFFLPYAARLRSGRPARLIAVRP